MAKRLTPPIPYFGGKGHMVKKLIALVPPHKTYIEVFGGAASLLFAKDPVSVDVYNDVYHGVVNLYRVLRDPVKFQQFQRLAELTPYSREEQRFCCANWQHVANPVEKAYRFYVMARMSFSGRISNKKAQWSFAVGATASGKAMTCQGYLSAVKRLSRIHQRLQSVQIESATFYKIIPRYDTLESFFYLDPPYVPGTRGEPGYKHEMTEKDHQLLVSLLLGLKGFALLSGYLHPVYQRLTKKGWTLIKVKVKDYSSLRKGSGTGKARTECLWMNYDPETGKRL
jgi:DNA adenine methylase